MSPDAFHDFAMALPGSTFDIKWGADRIYSVGGKMFASAGAEQDPAPKYAFKASDLGFQMLVEQDLAKPAPYLARAKWVQLVSADALEDEDLKAYIAEAHRIVAGKLAKKDQAKLA